jgi:hypothetical protein
MELRIASISQKQKSWNQNLLVENQDVQQTLRDLVIYTNTNGMFIKQLVIRV